MAVVSSVALASAAGQSSTKPRTPRAAGRLWPDTTLGFLFVDETGQSLRPHPPYHGVSGRRHRSSRYQGLGWVAQERQPLNVGDVSTDARY
jgi:hypothetical protein